MLNPLFNAKDVPLNAAIDKTGSRNIALAAFLIIPNIL
jgi:hypothetical protein